MTLKEKIEVIRAYDEGKEVQVLTPEGWSYITNDIWDFKYNEYRVKPDETTKFKYGDVLLAKEGEYQSNPARFEVSDIKQGCYCFKDYMDKPINDIERDYINERDVLWYFEISDYIFKKYSIHTTRATIPEMNKEFGANSGTLSWQPMYSIGFKLKEN